MKKGLLLSVLAILLAFSGQSQNGGVAPLAKGQSQLNFGVGFSNHGLPTYLGWDIALHKDVTIEPEVQINFLANNGLNMAFLFGADYHWNYLIGIPSNWDFYAGLQVGWGFYFDGYEDNFGGLRLGARIGGRWYWSERWGLHLELGGGTGYGGKFGVSVKL